jgi:hypothetical protein
MTNAWPTWKPGQHDARHGIGASPAVNGLITLIALEGHSALTAGVAAMRATPAMAPTVRDLTRAEPL